MEEVSIHHSRAINRRIHKHSFTLTTVLQRSYMLMEGLALALDLDRVQTKNRKVQKESNSYLLLSH